MTDMAEKTPRRSRGAGHGRLARSWPRPRPNGWRRRAPTWSPSRARLAGWKNWTTGSRPRAGTRRSPPMDLTDDNAIAHLCRSIHDRWGRADIWVHAAIHVSALTPAPAYPGQGSRPLHRDEHPHAFAADRQCRPADRALRRAQCGLLRRRLGREIRRDLRHVQGCPTRAGQDMGGGDGEARAQGASAAPGPMPTATRARFYPGEDRSALVHPREEAARLLGPLFEGA